MTMTTRTLKKNFEGFSACSQVVREQSGKKGIWACLLNQKYMFKNMKTSLCKEKDACPTTQFLNFVINNLCENKKFAKLFLSVPMYGAQVEYFKHKNGKNLMTLSL